MDAKEYLKGIKKANDVIEAKLRKRDQLQGMRYRITQTMKADVVSGGGSHGGFSTASDELIDLEREIDAAVDRYVDLLREAEALLEQVDGQNYYKVLRKRYWEYESIEKIAVDMGYTYRNVCYLHGRALQVFQKALDKHNAT